MSKNSESARSGLATWRARQAEEKRQRLAELEELRRTACTVVRDGREFTLVRIPDRYDEVASELPVRVQIRRQRKRT